MPVSSALHKAKEYPFLAETLVCDQLLPRIHQIPPMRSEPWIHGRLHALDGCRGLPSMTFSVPTFIAIPEDHRLLQSGALDDYSVCCVRKRMRFLSTEGLWNAILCMMKQVPGAESRLDDKSRNFGSVNARFGHNGEARLTRKLIPAMARVRV